METRAPDFKIETVQELESYLGLRTDHNVGVRVEAEESPLLNLSIKCITYDQ